MKYFIARVYQKILYIFSLFLKFREPIILNNNEELINVLKKKKIQNILLLSGKRVCKQDFYINLDKKLKDEFNVLEYTDIPTDPDIDSIEKAVSSAKAFQTDVIIAVGGGSTMDAGKAIAARYTNKKSLRKMRGLLKVTKKPLLLITIPTTAGTGSECTVASVVSDLERGQKYAINDPKLIPEYALLDPTVLLTLPADLTAQTALDALTHAIEAYLGNSNTETTKRYALSAIHKIYENLQEAYEDNTALDVRKELQIASYQAGIAFTKAYVGYVHAFSHAIAATYHLSHGYLNGIILPVILEAYGEKIHKKLVVLNYLISENDENPNTFIKKIKELLITLNQENILCDIIKDEDIPKMIEHINKEVYPLYPVPKFFSNEELLQIFNKLRNIA